VFNGGTRPLLTGTLLCWKGFPLNATVCSPGVVSTRIEGRAGNFSHAHSCVCVCVCVCVFQIDTHKGNLAPEQCRANRPGRPPHFRCL